MTDVTLFMVLLGCTPPGRNIEQHDIFFGVGRDLRALVPQIEAFWPEGRVHIDVWAKVDHADGYDVSVVAAAADLVHDDEPNRLFFVNLGGYQPGLLEELHEKRLVAAPSEAAAVSQCRRSLFYRRGQASELASDARSHVDDKHLAETLIADDVVDVSAHLPRQYRVVLTPAGAGRELTINVGYLPLRRV